MKDPAEQFQVGDPVIFTPEGIRARVTGYLMEQQIGHPPKVLMYELDCGFRSAGQWLVRDTNEKARGY